MQQFQQVFRVRLQFLQRFPANTRYQPGDGLPMTMFGLPAAESIPRRAEHQVDLVL
jgi:hypothetical protein